MKKILFTLITVVMCASLVGCFAGTKSVFNEDRNRDDYKKITSVNGMKFEVPKVYLEDAESILEVGSIEDAKSDETYYSDTIPDTYMLFNYDEFFIFANSNIEDLDLEDIENTEDLQDSLDDSDNDDFELGKNFIKVEEDGVTKVIVDSSANLELTDDLSETFVGKIAFVQEDDICSVLFMGILEDSDNKDAQKMIGYVTKSLVSDDYEEVSYGDTVEAQPAEETDDANISTQDPQEPEATPTTNNSVNTLSSDIYSFQVQLDNDVYQFPMTFDQFVSYGWVYDGDDTQTIKPDQYSGVEVFKKGGFTLYASIVNFGMNVEPYKNCLIGGISIDEFQAKDQNVTITLPGGIVFGKAYGDATDVYDGDMYSKLTYSLGSYQQVEIQISKETKVVSSIDIENLSEPEEAAAQDTSVSSEVPAIVTQYKAPTSLGNDFMKFIVEYDGDLYKLPAPVSEFEKNGWKIVAADSDSTVKAGDFGWVTLMKNNQQLRVIAENYADTATTINNCFLTNIKASELTTNVPMTVQKGIKIGMSKKNLEKALSGVKYEKNDEDSTMFTYYEIVSPERGTDCITITLRNETSTIEGIDVSYSPKQEDLYK